MNTHVDKIQENRGRSAESTFSQKQSSGNSNSQVIVDNRPETIVQRELHDMADNSERVTQFKTYQDMANNSLLVQQSAQLQSEVNNHLNQKQVIQKKVNNTGLPDNLKTGIENLSGLSLNDVKVHRNSDKPAQLQARAYAQGTDIYLGPGQEKHLSHEAWHVVQQKSGVVKPTMEMNGTVKVNDDVRLEKEADVMGAKAISQSGGANLEGGKKEGGNNNTSSNVTQLVKEDEFMADPDAFMDANLLLIRYTEGVANTYDFSKEGIKFLTEKLNATIARASNPNVRKSLKKFGIDQFKKSVMETIFNEVMDKAKVAYFTLEPVEGKEEGNSYIVTPAFEAMASQFPKVEYEVDESGEVLMEKGVPVLKKYPTSFYISLLARKASKPRPAAYIPAAFIPYDPNIMPTEQDAEVELKGVDLPTGDQESKLKFAFTAGMNGCAIAVKKKSENEITAWHYPSPDSAPAKFTRWKESNEVTDTFRYAEYADPRVEEENRIKGSERNHETTTVMIRDGDGSWRIKSQQNVGPKGKGQAAALLELGKIAGRQLTVGEEYDG